MLVDLLEVRENRDRKPPGSLLGLKYRFDEESDYDKKTSENDTFKV